MKTSRRMVSTCGSPLRGAAWGLWATVCCVALTTAACGDDSGVPGLTDTPVGGSGGSVGGGGGAPPVFEEGPFDPPPPPPELSVEQVAELGAEIDGILGGVASYTHSVLIVGADTGQVIYEREADQLLKPASNTKMFTTAAALVALGEDHQHEARVYATQAPSGGTVDGDLVLLGHHDFTWSTRYYTSARFPLDQLAGAVAAAGVTQVTGAIQARGEFLYDGYNLGTYDAAAHRALAASRFRDALTAVGISSAGTATSVELTPPAGGVELAGWDSLPLAEACSMVNRVSHNEFADILSRHVGYLELGESTYDGGESEMLELLSSAPVDAGGNGTGAIDVTGVTLNDGSGLSHGNRVAARHVVSLLRLMDLEPTGLPWWRTFSVAGVRGTIGSRMTGPDTIGRVFAKTGTLSDTIALSGVLFHRHDGQRYYFSLLMNAVGSSTAARSAHDQIVTALAADRRALGSRPAAPSFYSAKNDGNGVTLTAEWSPVDGADGYLVWRSPDGKRWPRDEARYVAGTSHRTVGFAGSDTTYLRISALGAAGESDPSDVYSAGVGDAASTVLLVDGNDRWELQPSPENTLGAGHDFLAQYGEVMAAWAHDTCTNEAALTDACPIGDYPIVVWALGEESTDTLSVAPDEQVALTEYLAGGGGLFVSGAELAFDLGTSSRPEDQTFLNDVLHAGYVGDDAGTHTIAPSAGFAAELGLASFLTPDRMVVDYPDQLEPLDGAEPIVDYVGGAGGVAGLRFDGGYRVVAFGFPLESIGDAQARLTLLTEALSFLDGS